MSITKPPISYTSRDFQSIRNDLINYVKVYYPDTYKDFNEASFGSLMFDLVANIGDSLSYYIDYQANETFIETALQKNNLIKIAKQMGYKMGGSPASSGICAFYVSVPAQSNGGQQNTDLIPILKKGSTMTSDGGASFILTQDIDFSSPSVEILPIRESASEAPSAYAYKAYGKILSGEVKQTTVVVGDYKKFLKLQIADEKISEIISVIDSSGGEYYEVEYLTQDTIFKEIKNTSSDSESTPFVLKEFQTYRRFMTEYDEDGNCSLQFGAGSENEFQESNFPDPSEVSLQFYGKNYFSEKTFDPNVIGSSETLGISPANTTLTIQYRANTSDSINASVGSVNLITNSILEFRTALYSKTEAESLILGIEADNEEPIVGSFNSSTSEEIRLRAYGAFATQNRAVTKQDYIAMVYRMPASLGAIKRANITQDKESIRRNLNLYIVSETVDGELTLASETLKQNLKTWISKYKMINDSIDILDPVIINIGIDFEVIIDLNKDTPSVLNACMISAKQPLAKKLNIGEPLYLTDLYKVLNAVNGVIDTKNIRVFQKFGEDYSTSQLTINDHLSKDGRYLSAPENTILEIRDFASDVTGMAI